MTIGSIGRRGWITIGIAATAGVAAALVLNPRVQQSLFDRGAEAVTAKINTAPLADDALRVAVCGSSAPLPSARRAKACVAVFAGGKFYVVDTGPESTENLSLWGIPLAQIGGVLLTHFHSDHIGDLGELQLQTWAGGRREPLAVYGGPGVDQVVDGFNRAYAMAQGYRTEHHGESVMPSKSWGLVARTVALDGPPTPAKDRTATFYDDGSLRITAIEVNHAPIARAARGAELLVSEAISRSMTSSLESAADKADRGKTAAIMHDVQDYHISPEAAARIANEAGVRMLVYYHLLPAPDNFLMRRLFAQGVDAVRPDHWTIADDGSLYTLPFDSRDVLVGRIDQ